MPARKTVEPLSRRRVSHFGGTKVSSADCTDIRVPTSCWGVLGGWPATRRGHQTREKKEGSWGFENDMRHHQKVAVEHSAGMHGERLGGWPGQRRKQARKRADGNGHQNMLIFAVLQPAGLPVSHLQSRIPWQAAEVECDKQRRGAAQKHPATSRTPGTQNTAANPPLLRTHSPLQRLQPTQLTLA